MRRKNQECNIPKIENNIPQIKDRGIDIKTEDSSSNVTEGKKEKMVIDQQIQEFSNRELRRYPFDDFFFFTPLNRMYGQMLKVPGLEILR